MASKRLSRQAHSSPILPAPVRKSLGQLESGRALFRDELIRLRNRICAAQDAPRFVVRGDSWFAFKEVIALPPFKPSNLAEAIQELGYYVDIEAANGTTAIEMAWDNNLAKLGAELISSRADALLFSGGGDDLFAQGAYRPAGTVSAFEWLLNPASRGRLPVNQKRLDQFLIDIQTAIQRIADVASRYGLPCFLHTYAVPIASGRPAYPGFGPWIRPALENRGYDPDRDGPAILTIMVETFYELLQQIGGTSIQVVNLVPIVRKSDWRDELHLHLPGWRRCALEFQRVFQTIPTLAKPTKTIDMDLLAEQAEQLISDQVEIARQMLGSNLQSLTRFKN